MFSYQKRLISILAFILIVASSYAQVKTTPATSTVNFKEVAARLDTGGDLFLVLNAEGTIDQAFEYINKISELAPADDKQTAELKTLLKNVETFLRKNGFFALQGYGLSMVPQANGLNKVKSFVRRDTAAVSSPLWKGMVGGAQKELLSHKYLPTDAVMVSSSTGDIKQFWKLFRTGVKELAKPEMSAQLDQTMAGSGEMLGITVEQLIASLGDESFISIQLSKTETIQIPSATPGKSISIPAPSLLMGFAVKDSSILDAIKKMLSTPDQPMKSMKVGADTLYSLDIPLPLPVPVQPTIVLKSGMLLLGSSPEVVKNALSAAASPSKNLMSTAEFKKLFAGLPTKNNGMNFLSERFAKTVMAYQRQIMQATAGTGAASSKSMTEFYDALQNLQTPQAGASVMLNWKSGVQTTGVSTTGGKEAALSLLMFPIGLSAAIAVPAFIQYRTDTREGLCQNNLRLIDHAKEVVAIKDNLVSGDMVTADKVTAYITGGMPICPQGGTYTLNAVSTAPSCSVHGTIDSPK